MVIYDSECYPNVYLIGIADPEKKKYVAYEISDRRDDRDALYEHCRSLYRDRTYMVGFNCIKYDYPLLDFVLKNKTCNNDEIYKKSCSLISDDSPHIKQEIPQLDLMLIHHMDNKAKMTSLKVLEFNMRMDDIEELPFKPGTVLKHDEIVKLKKYMKHDVRATHEFFKRSEKKVDFRREISNKYGKNMMNHNDVRIGKEIFIDALIKAGIKIKDENGNLRQTPREKIVVKDILLPMSFNHPELRRVYEEFQNLVITNTKGNFKISAELDGFILNYGTGGLHGSVTDTLIRSDDKYLIENRDVVSYYSNIAIRNRFYPEHLTEKFCDVYEWIYNERIKHKKGTPENAAYKLALNGIYGASNSEFSPFYDPKYTMSTTINGQLLLSSLAEKILEVDGVVMLDCNTDGLCYKMPRSKEGDVDSVCAEWEKSTHLTLETSRFNKIYYRDGNSYIGEEI
jgi:hypothetical protein